MSCFQSLPADTIDSIIDFVFASCIYHHNYIRDNACSLLHSCQEWRAGYLRRACRVVSLTYGYSGNPELKYDMCPQSITPLGLPLSHFAKTFNINMRRPKSITNGDAMRWLQESGAVDLKFTSVNTLTINLGYLQFFSNSNTETLQSIQNIGNILRYARKTAPNVRKAVITWSIDCSPDMSSECHTYLSKTITDFFYGLHDICFREEAHFNRASQLVLENLPGLTRFSYVFSRAHTWFVELVRRSYKTLIVLEANSLPKSIVDDLLYVNSSETIAYPFLEILDIQSVCHDRSNDEESDTLRSEYQVVHFPSLKSLYVSGVYPFSENILTRDNNTTLEYLNLSKLISIDEYIRAYRSLCSSQFSNLRHLIVNSAFDGSGQTPENSRDIYSVVSFLKATVPAFTPIRRLELNGSTVFNELYDGLSEKSLLSNLRSLSVSNMISFKDIAALLQNTPCLHYLKCGLNTRLSIEYGDNEVELKSFLEQSVNSLGKWLNTFEAFTFKCRDGKYLSQVALLLTIGCPRLVKIRFTDSDKSIVANTIGQTAKTEPFREYIEPCRRALSMFKW